MRARSATFIRSASTPETFPEPSLPEVGFAGRSNVGKSSLINTLTGAKGLAKTSATPGRTRLLNWFQVKPPQGSDLFFVDLPGYGYAKLSKEIRAGFGPLVDALIEQREPLRAVVVILDARRGAEEEELDFVPWLEEKGRRPIVVLTKADKLPKSKRFPVVAAVKKALALRRDPILFSATEPLGIDELWRAILAAVIA